MNPGRGVVSEAGAVPASTDGSGEVTAGAGAWASVTAAVADSGGAGSLSIFGGVASNEPGLALFHEARQEVVDGGDHAVDEARFQGFLAGHPSSI